MDYFFRRNYGPPASDSSSDDEDDRDEHEEKEKKPKSAAAEKLEKILDGDDMDTGDDDDDGEEKPVITKVKTEELVGFCVECEDQPYSVSCDVCKDNYCDVCFLALHKKGNRKSHKATKVQNTSAAAIAAQKHGASTATTNQPKQKNDQEDDTEESTGFVPSAIPQTQDQVGVWFLERSKYIPLRLNMEERKQLRLIQAALNVSEYTDKVDIISYGSKSKRMAAQLKDICAILSGLLIASDYNKGQSILKDKEFKDNAELFQKLFEIGRRHKIMNPEKMRTEYGKLVYLLQDSMSPHVQELIQFQCVKKIRTVYQFLDDRKSLGLLQDKLIAIATKEIIPDGKTRIQVRGEIKEKEKAIEILAQQYSTPEISGDDIKLCLYSIGDNHSYLRGARDPVDKMIRYLVEYFKPDEIEEPFSLGITAGHGGARLTHNHTRQYHYVLQSMLLWREILHDMFKLWYLAEEDLLDGDTPYRLTDTGQGLNRVQAAPRTGKAIHRILNNVQSKVSSWVGSSVIHLGDHNVPNSLNFIDKYNQVPRILNPLVICLEKIEDLVKDPKMKIYIDSSFGGVEKCRKTILTDFFRHGFDGSGADNFFDAGSCIDGRLTSTWQWCSKIEKKSFFNVFLLTGFVSFDGSFA